MGDTETDIRALRAEIDAIDREIVRQLNERAGRTLRIRGIKERSQLSIFDRDREEEIQRLVAEANRGPVTPEALREIYETILRQTKASG